MSKQMEEVMGLVQEYASVSESFPQYATMREVRESWTAIEAKLRELLPVWQPIETAEKSLTIEFDGWNGERVNNVSWGWPDYHPKEKRCWIRAVYETGYGWINEEVHGLTHWIPIPKAPE